ncbi:MAG: SCP2 sterol-binding domain-containing protein [Motiliproteus sp.]
MKTIDEVLAKLPEKFLPDAAADLTVVFQFLIDESRHFSIEIDDKQCQICEHEHPDPDVTLIMSSETFVSVISGDIGGTTAYMTGQLRAEGNIMLATKLNKLFQR